MIRTAFRALRRNVRALIERMTTEEKGYQRIQFTDSFWGLYLRFCGQRFQLGSGALEMVSVDLSLDEAHTLFVSISSACEKLEKIKADFGDWSWTTDARLNQTRPDRLWVRITGVYGRGTIGLSRRKVLSACEEFSSELGKLEAQSGG
jgi:hypothetical protein